MWIMWITRVNPINTRNIQWEKVFITFTEMWMKKTAEEKFFLRGQG